MSRLDEGLQRLAGELAECGAPAEVERAVVAEFERVWRRRRGRLRMAVAGTLAASLAGLWLLARRPEVPPVPAQPASREQASEHASQQAAEQAFVPIPYVLPPTPYERVEVVRMTLPVAALIAAGFRMQGPDLGAEAEADVMVGQDGRARAIRLIAISSLN